MFFLSLVSPAISTWSTWIATVAPATPQRPEPPQAEKPFAPKLFTLGLTWPSPSRRNAPPVLDALLLASLVTGHTPGSSRVACATAFLDRSLIHRGSDQLARIGLVISRAWCADPPW